MALESAVDADSGMRPKEPPGKENEQTRDNVPKRGVKPAKASNVKIKGVIFMKIDWTRKLTSRKLWVSVAGFVAGLIVIFGGSQEDSDKISGSILSGAAVIGYVLGEGLTDASAVKKEEDKYYE